MNAVGWKNGKFNRFGIGFGIKIDKKDRDQYFNKTWDCVVVYLENNQQIIVSLSPSFWSNCTELRSCEFGKYMISKGLAPWPDRNPPIFELKSFGDKKFKLSIEKEEV